MHVKPISPPLCLFSSLLVFDRDVWLKRGCSQHPNNEVHFLFFLWRFLFLFFFFPPRSLCERREKRAHSGGQLRAVDIAPLVACGSGQSLIITGSARSRVGFVRKQLSVLRGRRGRKEAAKVEPGAQRFVLASGAQGLVGRSISAPAFGALTCVSVHIYINIYSSPGL